MDKIYSRNKRIQLPKIKVKFNIKLQENKKRIKIIIVVVIAMITFLLITKSITPIIDKQCVNMAKSIATKISNEQTTIVMDKYKYDDICKVTKDSNGNIAMISANIITVNEIMSNIALKIQEELDKTDNNRFNIKIGSFTRK